MIHSRWFRLVVIVVLMVAGGLFLWQYNQVDKPQLVNSDGRVFEKARVVDIVRDNLQEDGSRVGDQIVTLRMEDGPDAGQTVQANCPNGLLFGTVCQPGMAVIVISANVGAMGVLFLFFPMVLRGMGPVAAAVITSAIVLAATMYLINGWTKKSLAAFGATLGGILTACLAAILFGHAVNLSGYNVSNIENLMFVAQNTLIDVGQILFAGILFASLGAVMDIAMDVTAACAELERHKPDISRKVLFTAGMNVGRDVMGTMSTTLILAFFGGSLGVWLLDYAYDLPYLQLINSNAVGIEIMKGFSASFGVIFTVPIAAALSAVTHKVEHK